MNNAGPVLRDVPQRHPITHQPCLAIQIGASPCVIDPVAVADIEAALAAVPPDRVLHEPRKSLRKRWIELSGVDPPGDGLNLLPGSPRT